MGVAAPWDTVRSLPAGGLAMTSEIAALNLLRLVGKEGHLRRTLRELAVRPDEWFNDAGRHVEGLVRPCAPSPEPQ
eukprot:9156830-Prorocentrum_lima.AAC.1